MALDEIDAEENIRAAVVTGAGRGFCSGADVNRQLESLEGRQSQSPATQGPGITALAPHIRLINQPVIAAVNGVAAGEGWLLPWPVTSESPLRKPDSHAYSLSAPWSRIREHHIPYPGWWGTALQWMWP